jgi:hypothetical protein
LRRRDICVVGTCIGADAENENSWRCCLLQDAEILGEPTTYLRAVGDGIGGRVEPIVGPEPWSAAR